MILNKEKILDEFLIMQFKKGDAKSLSLFVKRWHSKLIWFSYQVINDREEAKDIVQENWTIIISGLQTLNEVGSYKSWMFRVIRNKTIDRIRRIQKQKNTLEEIGKVEGSDTEAVVVEENINKVTMALNSLPKDLKQVLHLFYIEEQSVIEIAEILSIPQGTVKSRLFRGRELMKKSFLKNNIE